MRSRVPGCARHGRRRRVSYPTRTVRALRRVRRRTPIPGWVVHHCRTTFRTHPFWAGEEGGLAIPAHVAHAVLGHSEETLGFERCTGESGPLPPAREP